MVVGFCIFIYSDQWYHLPACPQSITLSHIETQPSNPAQSVDLNLSEDLSTSSSSNHTEHSTGQHTALSTISRHLLLYYAALLLASYNAIVSYLISQLISVCIFFTVLSQNCADLLKYFHNYANTSWASGEPSLAGCFFLFIRMWSNDCDLEARFDTISLNYSHPERWTRTDIIKLVFLMELRSLRML